ncbi:hypothetical protein [Streptomyces sp. NPDC059970]|uniref:hypothetical protein n=1 Tax=Streptomyces sp. NPDC059970 TaxID=3347019 RepID=UPI0036BDBF6E
MPGPPQLGQGVRGPCRPLTDEEQRQIDVFAVSARAIERALDIGDGQVRLAELCPICDGPSTSKEVPGQPPP